MRSSGHLVTALRRSDFRRLMTIRLTGQFGDGAFQASLAGAVLFNPDHETSAAQVAAGFAVILLPYSFIGPFAGVLIDRWSRQRVLAFANLLRGVGVVGIAAEIAGGLQGEAFYASALVIISANRFVLSALSAGLPHVVEPENLITSNALSTTAGGVATALGGGVAIALRIPLDGNSGYAATALVATAAYLLAAFTATGFDRMALGPDEDERAERQTARHVARGLLDGVRHIRSHADAEQALIMIALVRFCFGISTISTLLLYRNYFHDDGFFRAGISGLGQIVVALAIGSGLAAVITPAAVRRFGSVYWPTGLLICAGVLEFALCLPFALAPQVIGAACFGFVVQAVKICVDTLVQQRIEDDYRGRVFSVYDTMFNAAFVAATALTAAVIPESGRSTGAVCALGIGYLVIAAAYLHGGLIRSAQRTTQ